MFCCRTEVNFVKLFHFDMALAVAGSGALIKKAELSNVEQKEF